MSNLKPLILTFVQYASLILLLATNNWFTNNFFILSFQIAGFVLGFWAIFEMSKSRLNITPTPLSGSILIDSGPYNIVRHPMYLALILVLLPSLIINFNLLGIILFIIFFVNLMLKILYEEKLLLDYFEGYPAYLEKTWKLIPYIY